MKKTAGVIAIFLMFSMSAMAAEYRSAVQDKSSVSTAELHLLLNSFVALGEGHLESVLNELKLMSVTEEVQSGKWENMKPILAEFGRSGIKAAAVWFARPDGSYFTVGKGLTEFNLRDRPYFPRLMAGEEVAGDLVISKSTGKRTAIVAVPAKKNGKIIGALGASLSVEEISRMLDEKMALPENMVFYALDANGQTSLHRNAALLFAYPSDMGSKSLTEKVREMLSKQEGELSYQFEGQRTVVFKKSPLTGWTFAVGLVSAKQ
jgi:Cache domain